MQQRSQRGQPPEVSAPGHLTPSGLHWAWWHLPGFKGTEPDEDAGIPYVHPLPPPPRFSLQQPNFPPSGCSQLSCYAYVRSSLRSHPVFKYYVANLLQDFRPVSSPGIAAANSHHPSTGAIIWEPADLALPVPVFRVTVTGTEAGAENHSPRFACTDQAYAYSQAIIINGVALCILRNVLNGFINSIVTLDSRRR